MQQWPEADPSASCLIMDFDGVLAPIVDDPASSSMSDRTRSLVQALVRHLGRVALVSGRQAAFLADRANIDGLTLVGLYGLERVEDGAVVPDERVAPYEGDLDRARQILHDAVKQWPGAELEDKGRALGVHWRRADSRQAAEQALTSVVREVAGSLAVENGKLVIELRPPVAANKGTAVAQLSRGYEAVAYAGDDLGDLPAFEEVRRQGGFTIAVDHGEETDQRVLDAGTIVVDGTEGMADWLESVLDKVRT